MTQTFNWDADSDADSDADIDAGSDTAVTRMVCFRHDYQRVLHMDPLNVRARVNLALGLQVSSKFQQAWDQFSIAISVDPRKSLLSVQCQNQRQST